MAMTTQAKFTAKSGRVAQHSKTTRKSGKPVKTSERLIVEDNPLIASDQIRQGLPFSSIAKLQKATDMSAEKIAAFINIPLRTLIRRQKEGKLRSDESDRVWRASRIFDKTVELFAGDVESARRWLQSPQIGLGGRAPVDFATTDVGAREVEDLIGRIEHGVFS